MKLFLTFALVCVLIGIFLRKQDLKLSMVMLMGLCLVVCLGYLYFNQI